MYHSISDQPFGIRILSVRKGDFSAQLSYLKQAGYRSLTVSKLLAILKKGQTPPSKTVVLTFDDGYANNYTAALPLLQRYGFTATFYVVVSSIGTSNHLSWSQIRQIDRAGMEVGVHSWSHPDLRTLGTAGLLREVDKAKGKIEENLGHKVISYCYPIGYNNARVRAAVTAAGFQGAVATQSGLVTPLSRIFALPRIAVSRDTPLKTLVTRLSKG